MKCCDSGSKNTTTSTPGCPTTSLICKMPICVSCWPFTSSMTPACVWCGMASRRSISKTDGTQLHLRRAVKANGECPRVLVYTCVFWPTSGLSGRQQTSRVKVVKNDPSSNASILPQFLTICIEPDYLVGLGLCPEQKICVHDAGPKSDDVLKIRSELLEERSPNSSSFEDNVTAEEIPWLVN